MSRSATLSGQTVGRGPTTTPGPIVSPVAPGIALAGHAWVWLAVFTGFFVLREPAPYDLLGAVAIGAGFLFGLPIPRTVLPLVGFLLLYVVGGFIGVTFAPDVSEARFQIMVTTFLAFSSIFFACYTARDTVKRVGLIMNGWQCGAILAALAGIAGYFGIAGTGELFTLYGRAKGTFEDPNVFAPFLTGAIVFAVYKILSQPVKSWGFALIVFAICAAALLLSFSRGAWGYTAYAVGVITILHFVLTPNPAERLRIVVLAILGFAVLVMGLAVALSIPAVADLLTQRASLIQSYDSGELGRFGRQLLGLKRAIENPFGLGVLGFRAQFGLDPHNVYLNALVTHGWAGFFAYTVLVFTTAFQLLRVVLTHPPLRKVAVPLFALFTGMMLMGTFIDTDRWRHFFILLGLSWGVITAAIMNPYQPGVRHRMQT